MAKPKQNNQDLAYVRRSGKDLHKLLLDAKFLGPENSSQRFFHSCRLGRHWTTRTVVRKKLHSSGVFNFSTQCNVVTF